MKKSVNDVSLAHSLRIPLFLLIDLPAYLSTPAGFPSIINHIYTRRPVCFYPSTIALFLHPRGSIFLVTFDQD